MLARKTLWTTLRNVQQLPKDVHRVVEATTNCPPPGLQQFYLQYFNVRLQHPLQHHVAMTTRNFNDNISSLQLQHNFIQWQHQFSSITIRTITTPITTFFQWQQYFNYNTISLNDNITFLQLQQVQLQFQLQHFSRTTTHQLQYNFRPVVIDICTLL